MKLIVIPTDITTIFKMRYCQIVVTAFVCGKDSHGTHKSLMITFKVRWKRLFCKLKHLPWSHSGVIINRVVWSHQRKSSYTHSHSIWGSKISNFCFSKHFYELFALSVLMLVFICWRTTELKRKENVRWSGGSCLC